MTVACQRSYTVQVLSQSLYYWTLNEPNPTDNRVDSAQGVILQVANGGGFLPPNVGTGLFGNGIIFNHPTAQGASLITGGLAGGTDTKLLYTQGQGFTAWGWIKMNSAFGVGPIVDLMDLTIFTDQAGVNSVAEIRILISNSVLAVGNDDVGQAITNVTLFNPPVGQWNFTALRYDPSTGFISGRFNNSAWVNGNTFLNMKTGSFGSMTINTTGGGANFDCTVDEVGVAKKVLSDAQVNQIYNGGVGVTWPAVSTIVG